MPRTSKPSQMIDASAPSIISVTTAGFKSIGAEQTLEIRPLTLLAGANSSGKSSMMQPLLLLKQTLETQYDPGPLLLNGAHAKFTSASQFLNKNTLRSNRTPFSVGISLSNGLGIVVGFRSDSRKKLDLDYNNLKMGNRTLKLNKELSGNQLLNLLKIYYSSNNNYKKWLNSMNNPSLKISRNRCFYDVILDNRFSTPELMEVKLINTNQTIGRNIQEIIHLPGLRGNPERSYPVTAIGPRFPGTFENYVASLIARWGSESQDLVEEVGRDLLHLGLTWKVEAEFVDETRVELRVGRLKKSKQGGAKDLVNVADVGFGVSQTLPVVVALHAARPGQIVYIEQPEIHLHPKAQVAMAKLLADAANRGVRVVIETHSSLLLLAVQSLVAEEYINHELIKLHWFTRDDSDGITHIQAADIDEAGRFGDWPEDFDEVALETENRYLSAAEARLLGELSRG